MKHFVATLKHNRGRKSEHFPKISSHRAKKTSGHLMLHKTNLQPPYPARSFKQANGRTASGRSQRSGYASRTVPIYG